MVGCWEFYVLQHLSSYQDGYQLETVHTHGDFIVLPHWKTRPPVPWPVRLFYIQAPSKVISGRVLTCYSVHWGRLYSAASLGDQAASHIILTPSQQSLSYPNNAERLTKKQQISICHWFDSTRFRTSAFESHDLAKRETDTYLLRPPRSCF